MDTKDIMQSPHEHRDNSFWVGLFLGGLIGAFLIVLLGTERGKKLAKRLQDEGLDLWDETKDKVSEKKEAITEQVMMKVEEIEEKGGELIDEGKELLEKGKAFEEKVVEKVVAVKEEAVSEAVAQADAALAHIEKLQERGRASTAELRKHLFKNIPKKTG
ncbi:MAG: YtxH domain-containing protein [Patescibacteria group bacterium]